MKRLLAFCLLAVSLAAPAMAATSAMPDLRAEHAWIRLMPGDLPSAGYLVLHNDSDTARTLTGVTSDAYGKVMLHKSTQASGVSHMQMVKSVPVPAHGKAEFAPGGYHLMLMQRGVPVQVGQTVVMVLHFADGGDLSVGFKVRAANASE